MTLTGDDYRYRFEVDAKQRFIDSLRERFNADVTYKGRVLKWDTVIQEKTNELGRYLNDRSHNVDFGEPVPVLERTDNRAVREAILTLTQPKAKKRAIGKSTLHYLRNKAALGHSFRVSRRIRHRLLAV